MSEQREGRSGEIGQKKLRAMSVTIYNIGVEPVVEVRSVLCNEIQ